MHPDRKGFRPTALLAAGTVLLAGLVGCAPAGPGPYQQQADLAGYACQQGDQRACYDYQALGPAANAEAYEQRRQQDAAVGTAVAVGVLGAVAGAAIASSSRDRGYRRHRGYHDRGYRGRDYERHYHRGRGW